MGWSLEVRGDLLMQGLVGLRTCSLTVALASSPLLRVNLPRRLFGWMVSD